MQYQVKQSITAKTIHPACQLFVQLNKQMLWNIGFSGMERTFSAFFNMSQGYVHDLKGPQLVGQLIREITEKYVSNVMYVM